MRNVYLFAIVFALAVGQTFADEVDRVGPTPDQVDQSSVYDLGIKPEPVLDPDAEKDTKVEVVETPKGKADQIVVFGASWCGPCQALKTTTLPALKAQGYKVKYLDVEDDAEIIARAYSGIKKGSGDEVNKYTAVPTIFYIRGDQIIKKEVGYKTPVHVKQVLWKPEELTVVDKIDEARNKLPWNK